MLIKHGWALKAKFIFSLGHYRPFHSWHFDCNSLKTTGVINNSDDSIVALHFQSPAIIHTSSTPWLTQTLKAMLLINVRFLVGTSQILAVKNISLSENVE